MIPEPFTFKDWDDSHRFAPSEILCLVGKGARLLPVNRSEAFPAGTHSSSMIRKECCAVVLQAENGAVRWFGCKRAYIAANLRMVLVGHHVRDEVRQKWQLVPAELRQA